MGWYPGAFHVGHVGAAEACARGLLGHGHFQPVGPTCALSLASVGCGCCCPGTSPRAGGPLRGLGIVVLEWCWWSLPLPLVALPVLSLSHAPTLFSVLCHSRHSLGPYSQHKECQPSLAGITVVFLLEPLMSQAFLCLLPA